MDNTDLFEIYRAVDKTFHGRYGSEPRQFPLRDEGPVKDQGRNPWGFTSAIIASVLALAGKQ